MKSNMDNDRLRLAKEALESGSYDKKTIEYIFPELVESKPIEWSEEDKKMLEKVIANIGCPPCTTANYKPIREMVEWLNFLKERYTWKPSEEQMTQLKKYCPDNRPLTLLYEQLKKLINEK